MIFNTDPKEITLRANAIQLLLLDVDGVLTDGRLFFSERGEELKIFNSLDGHGIKLLQNAGIKTGIISGRNSLALTRRLDELRITLRYLGREDKSTAFDEIMQSMQLHAEAIAYAGDDLPDLPLIRRCGLGIAVPNAHTEVRRAALMETESGGGSGAVREICDFLLQVQGKYPKLLEHP
jgi:3-deoxy-D-manno-octulosonate 8-phosphate phosphatase (KDO 8-P phosphatase)